LESSGFELEKFRTDHCRKAVIMDGAVAAPVKSSIITLSRAIMVGAC